MTSSRASGERPVRWHRALSKTGLFLVSLVLFIFAIALMKEGARGLVPLMRDQFAVVTPLRSLGFGWLFAYVVMSGSPVAAVALAFLDAGALVPLTAFTMITGSRLGANFIVIFLGFLYVLRGRDRAASLSMGLLSFVVTATTYLPALGIGIALLRSPWLASFRLERGMMLQSVFDRFVDPVVMAVNGRLPNLATFFVGLLTIVTSFALFDRCLPEMTLRESQVGRVSRLVYLPWVMFVLGGAITLVSMSVSISLGVLVPLSARGFVRRENVIPYIMGANITTFVDTLLASLLIDNPHGFVVVLAEMLSVTIVSVIILSTFYRAYERSMLAFVRWATSSNRNMLVCMVTLLLVPLMVLLI